MQWLDSNEPASAVEAVIDSRLRVQEEGFNRRTKHQEELFKKFDSSMVVICGKRFAIKRKFRERCA